MNRFGWNISAQVWAWAVFSLLALSFAARAEEEINDVDSLVAEARDLFDARFTEFTKEQNIMGVAKTPKGEIVEGPFSRKNADDKNKFQQPLTYHDKAFDEIIERLENGNEPEGDDINRRYAFTSEHGPLSDSSDLEKKSHELTERYAKQEKEKAEEKEGIEYRGMFQVTTKDINPNLKKDSQNQDKNKKKEEKEELESADKYDLRAEAKDEIEKLGETTYEPIAAAGRDNDKKDDPSYLPNLTFLYEASSRATAALWNNTLANLGQRRAYLAVPGDGGEEVKLSEDAPTCQDWKAQALAKVQKEAQEAQSNGDPSSDIKEAQEGIEKSFKQCEEVTKLEYTAQTPRYTEDEGKETESLKEKGARDEDARERDLRLQLESMAKKEAELKDFDSNWAYSEDDIKASVTVGFDGDEPITKDLSVKEQWDLYNQDLEDTAKAQEEVNQKLPKEYQTNPDEIRKYKSQKSVLEGNQVPESASSEFEQYESSTTEVPDTYDALVTRQE